MSMVALRLPFSSCRVENRLGAYVWASGLLPVCRAQWSNRGILPLAHNKSLLFGNQLVSNPFCVYGGVVADSDEVAGALRAAACELAHSLDVDALELRNLVDSGKNWPTKTLYSTFRRAIDPDPEVNMQAIPSKQRTMVRKGIKNGLISELGDHWDRAYRVYSESVRNLGTPVFSRKYFSVLREVFGEDCGVLMITHEGRDVAGVVSFYFRDEVLPYYGGSIAEARDIKGVNDFMYWELMRRSAEQGIRTFDFGRSKNDSGPYHFKKHWGFEPEPLHYEYHLVRATAVPEVNPLNPKYQLFIRAWKKLPLSVANRIGPFLAKNLG
ncbi:MAG: FemAB family PEP-CTERM system-associated protein [Porticoccaceae bacterium]